MKIFPSNTVAQYLIAFLISTTFVLLPEAMAANPLDGVSIMPSGDNKNISAMMKFFITLFILAFGFFVLFMAFGEAIMGVFIGLREARKSGNWGDFFINLIVILIGVGVTIFLGYWLFVLIEKFPDLWKTLTA